MTRLVRLTAPVLLATLLVGATGSVAGASPSADARIQQGITAGIASPALGSDVTVHVRGIRSDSTIAAVSADDRQIPASTMKVVTAATALMVYGESRRFATRVVAGADANRIILVGGGDPLLTRGQLAELAQRTAKTLRRSQVTSAVVDVDDYLFPQPSDAPGWAPGDRPTYAAAVRPLALFGEYSNDTVATAWSFFVQSLQEAGVRARVGSRILTPQGADRVAQVRPNTLREAVDVMLRVSENNVAEVLFRQVALGRGYPATWSGGSAAAKEVLRDLGLATWRLALIDGSGLSSDNRLTARFLTDVLDIAAGAPALDALIDGLPVAGRSGTLINRFAAPPASCARGAVTAKTGSLTGVSTLAGITRGSDGAWRSFAILVNRRPPAYPTSSTSLAIDTLAAVVRGCA